MIIIYSNDIYSGFEVLDIHRAWRWNHHILMCVKWITENVLNPLPRLLQSILTHGIKYWKKSETWLNRWGFHFIRSGIQSIAARLFRVELNSIHYNARVCIHKNHPMWLAQAQGKDIFSQFEARKKKILWRSWRPRFSLSFKMKW